MLAVTTYSVVLALHVMAVMLAYGLPLAWPLVLPRLRRDHPEAMAGIHDVQHTMNLWLTGPGTVLVLALGAYLASERDLWSEPWVHAGLAAILLIAAVGGWIVGASRRLAELARADVAGPEYAALFARYLRVEALLGVVVLAAVFVMAAKPFG